MTFSTHSFVASCFSVFCFSDARVTCLLRYQRGKTGNLMTHEVIYRGTDRQTDTEQDTRMRNINQANGLLTCFLSTSQLNRCQWLNITWVTVWSRERERERETGANHLSLCTCQCVPFIAFYLTWHCRTHWSMFTWTGPFGGSQSNHLMTRVNAILCATLDPGEKHRPLCIVIDSYRQKRESLEEREGEMNRDEKKIRRFHCVRCCLHQQESAFEQETSRTSGTFTIWCLLLLLFFARQFRVYAGKERERK